VLIEAAGMGRTGQFTRVCLDTPAQPGTIVDVVVAGHDGHHLLAHPRQDGGPEVRPSTP
jgi:hypothetical protein